MQGFINFPTLSKKLNKDIEDCKTKWASFNITLGKKRKRDDDDDVEKKVPSFNLILAFVLYVSLGNDRMSIKEGVMYIKPKPYLKFFHLKC